MGVGEYVEEGEEECQGSIANSFLYGLFYLSSFILTIWVVFKDVFTVIVINHSNSLPEVVVMSQM